MRNSLGALIVAIIIVIVVVTQTLFIVDQRQNAIVFRLGEVVRIIKQPGLYVKIPLIENVRYFDTRIRTIEPSEAERYLTSEKKNLLVDFYVKWRVNDVRQYYVSVGGDGTRAATRLLQTINSSLRDEFGNRKVSEVVSGQRDKVMAATLLNAAVDAKKIGVQVVDVRLRRVDLPQQVSDSVYKRMEAERKTIANQLRAEGTAEAERIKADADRQREVILAEAYAKAQKVKGEGDAKAAAIYAQAYEQNAEFYSFYRSLEAYRDSLANKGNVLVLRPDSDFFKYFRAPGKPSAK